MAKKIYVIKPNTLHPDAMFFLKEKAQALNPGAEIMENQSGPNYDPNMIIRCNALYVAVGKDRSIGKGVYGEVTQCMEAEKEVRVYEYDVETRQLVSIPQFFLSITDSTNFRAFGKIEGLLEVGQVPGPAH